jgi:Na+-translocating ferredoxin:NAD+ oxidoreductase RnfD subunit
MSDSRDSSRPEAAFVLMVMQSTFWFAAGVSAFPFALAGEVWMVGLGLASFVLAGLGCLLAIGLICRSLRSRKWTLVLEGVCLVGSALLLAVPIGANHGPVSLMVNIGLPLAVVALIRGKRMRGAFSSADAGARARAGG